MISRKSFTIQGDHVFDTPKIGLNGYYVLKSGGQKIATFEVISPHPGLQIPFSEVRNGSRSIGDQDCWVIPSTRRGALYTRDYREGINIDPRPDPLYPPNEDLLTGPCFEVLDYTWGVARPSCYLRIGEPFIWRYAFSRSEKANLTLSFAISSLLAIS
jgi:hypothetical protein